MRNGETFTLGELPADAPVIIETMAIWCTNCKQQMQEVAAAHELANFHSVSIDVDPHEFAEDLVAYADREAFDWPFVLAAAELATVLRDRIGTAVMQPPGMPKLLIGTDGSVELLPLGDLLSIAASLVWGGGGGRDGRERDAVRGALGVAEPVHRHRAADRRPAAHRSRDPVAPRP